MTTRLNKLLALYLGLSRRSADELIKEGKVVVNGVPAQLGHQATDSEEIIVNGKNIARHTKLTYIAFHKPVGYVCSRQAQGENPTVYSLLPSELHNLKLVGRLDKDSSGLLLLTNDGDFAHRMTHPKFHKQKSYEITLNKNLEPLHQQMINDHGIDLADGKSKLILERIGDSNRKNWRVVMHEGRNRQIRRTFEAMGYNVARLHRTHFGNFSLDKLDLEPKKWKEITLE